jgi:hypothetical protein
VADAHEVFKKLAQDERFFRLPIALVRERDKFKIEVTIAGTSIETVGDLADFTRSQVIGAHSRISSGGGVLEIYTE